MVVLCGDLDSARAVSAPGVTVVLVGPDAERLGRAAAAWRAGGSSGLVGIFVGDARDDGVWALAVSMAAELYGPDVQAGPRAASPNCQVV